jgi:hypothetical protein
MAMMNLFPLARRAQSCGIGILIEEIAGFSLTDGVVWEWESVPSRPHRLGELLNKPQ